MYDCERREREKINLLIKKEKKNPLSTCLKDLDSQQNIFSVLIRWVTPRDIYSCRLHLSVLRVPSWFAIDRYSSFVQMSAASKTQTGFWPHRMSGRPRPVSLQVAQSARSSSSNWATGLLLSAGVTLLLSPNALSFLFIHFVLLPSARSLLNAASSYRPLPQGTCS